MQTLSKRKKQQERLKTQADAIRNIIPALLLAFVFSACSTGTSSVPGVSAPSPPAVSTASATLVPVQTARAGAGSTIAPAAQTADPTGATLAPLIFDGKHSYDEYLLSQLEFGARPAGSKAIRATGDYIISALQANGWQVETQEFEYRGVPIRNVIGRLGTGPQPQIILGAHYDTRPRADSDEQDPTAPVPGANDGASGVAVLLELARTLDKDQLNKEVWLAFFDAEDNGGLSACDLQVVEMQTATTICDESKWGWSVGAEHVAENLPANPEAVIVVDMIGDANQNLHYEQNSDKPLQEELWRIAADLGYRDWFIPEAKWSMTDDHTPFLKRGIRAIDIIDFDYPPWHTVGDTADKVSADSLERVGRVLETWLEGTP